MLSVYEKIISDLNEQQKKAVLHKDGVLLVISGPGSGKTTILTRRIAYLLTQSINERFKILALTFTARAANEIRERVKQLVGDEVKRLFIGTFHSFCCDVLRKYGNYIGIRNDFTLYEKEDDYVQLLIEAIQDELSKENSIYKELLLGLREDQLLRSNVKKMHSTIIRLKNRLIPPNQLIQKEQHTRELEKLQVVYQLYNDKLRANNVVDFADLLFLTHKLLTEKTFISRQYRAVYSHLLIDEAQDTNKAQFELIKVFCGKDYQNVFIVADEDQLIYEWNDARFEYLKGFAAMKKATIIQMVKNYRCPKEVLDAANQLIQLNISRIKDKEELEATKMLGEQAIFLTEYDEPKDEALGVVHRIEELNEYDQTCIIARNRFLLERFEQCLKEREIPYHIVTDSHFFTREVNAIIHLLQATFNEEDRLHIRLLCNYFGINMDDLLLVTDDGTFFMRLIKKISEINGNLSNDLFSLINDKKNFDRYLDRLFSHLTGISIHNLEDDNEEAEDVIEDYKFLKELLNSFKRERRGEYNLGEFLAHVRLSPRNHIREGVSLLTGHAAKGLEYDYVFLVSMNQGNIS